MMIIPTGTPPDRFRLDTLRALQATAALREALESRERWLAGAHASTLNDLRELAESLQRDLDNEVDPGDHRLSPDAEHLLREAQQLQAVVQDGRPLIHIDEGEVADRRLTAAQELRIAGLADYKTTVKPPWLTVLRIYLTAAGRAWRPREEAQDA